VSCLVRVHRAGPLDAEELKGTVTTLIGAAFHNTRNHIASAIYELLRHPGELARLKADPALLPRAAEECLRYDPPVQMSIPRLATTEIVMGDTVGRGTPIGPGEPTATPPASQTPTAWTSAATRAPRSPSPPASTPASAPPWPAWKPRSRSGGFSSGFRGARLIDEEPKIDPSALPLTRGYRQVLESANVGFRDHRSLGERPPCGGSGYAESLFT